jgi:glc operon protein GlcG
MHDEIFPGPGGMPIRKEGRVVGAISTGGGLGPWTEIPGIDPSQLTYEGQPANAEDLIISYALQIPYQNQHEEGRRLPGPRTEERIDDLPHCLATARRYADRAIDEAARRGMRISVAVVDEAGQLMQMDRMDGATPMSPDLAEAKAQTALNFGRPTIDVQKTISADRLGEIRGIIHFKLLAGGGGTPIVRDGVVVGALGVHGGGGGEASDEIARAAVA